MLLEQVHGSPVVARGAEGIRETMAGYIAMKPDVVVHHTTVSGDFALCRSQWRITGTDPHGGPMEIRHHGMELMRRLPMASGFSSSTTLGGRIAPGSRPAAPHPINTASEDGGTRTGTCHLAAE